MCLKWKDDNCLICCQVVDWQGGVNEWIACLGTDKTLFTKHQNSGHRTLSTRLNILYSEQNWHFLMHVFFFFNENCCILISAAKTHRQYRNNSSKFLAANMMTSSNGNLSHVTGHLRGEFIGHRWIPRTKASDAELWCFFFICAWINGWVNNRKAGDLRRHRAHYDVTVMNTPKSTQALTVTDAWISPHDQRPNFPTT